MFSNKVYLIAQTSNRNCSGKQILYHLFFILLMSHFVAKTYCFPNHLRHPSVKTFKADSDKKPYQDTLCWSWAIAFKKFCNDRLAASTHYILSEFLSQTEKNQKFRRYLIEWNSRSWRYRANEYTNLSHLSDCGWNDTRTKYAAYGMKSLESHNFPHHCLSPLIVTEKMLRCWLNPANSTESAHEILLYVSSKRAFSFQIEWNWRMNRNEIDVLKNSQKKLDKFLNG